MLELTLVPGPQARAAVGRPAPARRHGPRDRTRAAVFLMDEPLSNLDAKLRVQMRVEIAALQARLGVTTVFVTHDQVEAMTMGHRVAVLRDGRLQQCDTPRVLYDRAGQRVRRRLHRLAGHEPVHARPVRDGSLALGGRCAQPARRRTARPRRRRRPAPGVARVGGDGLPAASRSSRSSAPTPTRSARRMPGGEVGSSPAPKRPPPRRRPATASACARASTRCICSIPPAGCGWASRRLERLVRQLGGELGARAGAGLR